MSDEEQVDEHEDETAADVPTEQQLIAYLDENADRVVAEEARARGEEPRAALGFAHVDDTPWATAEDSMTVENSDEDGGNSTAIAMASLRNSRRINKFQLEEVDNTGPEYMYHNWQQPQDAHHAVVSDGRIPHHGSHPDVHLAHGGGGGSMTGASRFRMQGQSVATNMLLLR